MQGARRGREQSDVHRPATSIKALQGLGSGLFELRDSDAAGTYRVIYYTSLGDVIYVLHCFQKKSTSGSKIPQKTSALIRARLKEARLHYGYYIDKAP